MSKLNVLDDTSIRGVENPRVIDLITHNKDSNAVVFSIVETRPWENSQEQLEQLEEKLNNYLDYILDGFFAEQYPQYKDIACEIQLECKEKPEGRVTELINAMQQYLKSIDIDFSVSIIKE